MQQEHRVSIVVEVVVSIFSFSFFFFFFFFFSRLLSQTEQAEHEPILRLHKVLLPHQPHILAQFSYTHTNTYVNQAAMLVFSLRKPMFGRSAFRFVSLFSSARPR